MVRLFALLVLGALTPTSRLEAANPIITNVYTADPAAMVSGDKVYLYTGHDEGSTGYIMKDWLCYSTSDMVNWKSEGSPMALGAFSWALSDAWAGQVIERSGKFYWYVPMSHKTITGFAIGVGVSDSPTGPFVDARGTALITNNQTADAAGKFSVFSWDDIDPSVFIDDDGQAYLFWGNTICHYVKLKANMIETEGTIQTITLPLFTEAPWVHKRNGIYYLSYAYGWEEKIAYATSTSINGPWTFRSVINDYVPNCNTNHQSIIDFKGQSYFIYHNGALPSGGSFRRSVCVDYLNYNDDGTIKPIVQTTAGVSAVTTGITTQFSSDPPNPTFSNVTVHDPAVVKEGSMYYVFGSHMASASSPDLMNWTQITTGPTYPNSLIRNQNPQTEFAATLAYAGNTTTFWAPDVFKLADGNFYFYYCACQGSSPLSALGIASSPSIIGPYADTGIILKSAGATPTVSPYNVNTMPNVVDPSIFYDNTGKLWMVYGSFSGGIFVLALDPVTGQPTAGQGYGKKLIGGNSSRIEGATIIYSPEASYYYLFMTFGGLDAAGGYNVRMGRSLNPDGPYLDAAGNVLTNVSASLSNDVPLEPYGVKLMGNYQFLHVTGEPGSTSRGYLSPGGVSFSRDATTGKYFMVFHTRFVGRGEQHEVRVHQMYINADGWPVIAPQRYAGETKSATDLGRIVGNYKLIKNLKAINATVNQSTVISLLADGTVTGASTGTWQLTGTNDLTLVLAGTTYRGVFARQWDDDTLVWVLDFTAIASDGVSVWGSKVAINTAPAILTDPASQSVLTGTSVTFTTMVSGDPAPAYQWKKNNVSIAGATNSSYPIANIALGDAGSYSVVATNSVNAATSTAATLTVTSATVAPAITTQPVSQTINEGSAVTFAAAASGDPTPTFQWKKNNATIGGATSSTYQILTVTAGDAGNYTVVATNSVGNATSNGATLTVIVAPTNAIISIAVQ